MTDFASTDGNAFTRPLGPPISIKERARQLRSRPPLPSTEPGLCHAARRDRVLSLRRYFKPDFKHVRFAEGLRSMILEGYAGRPSSERERDRRVLDLAEASRVGLLPPARPSGMGNRAASAGFFGFSGMGKTFMVEHALSKYDQVVDHGSGAAQILWMKLDCPPGGSLRELCIKFFRTADELLRRPFYSHLCAGPTSSEDSMVDAMRRVAAIHDLGCLVIDEIQNLPSEGPDKDVLFSFLLNLVNEIGVPVMVMGTLDALDLIDQSAPLSRRFVGIGSATWHRLRPSADGAKGEWENFLEDLWRYQWTDTHAELTDDIRLAFWEETQGVVDLVVKLFCLVQMRLILLGEANSMTMADPPPELVTAESIRERAREEFTPVHEMIKALKGDDERKARGFGDYGRFQKAMDRKLVDLAAPEVTDAMLAAVDDVEEADVGVTAEQLEADEREVVAVLSRLGQPEEVVRSAVRRAKASLGVGKAVFPVLFQAAQVELSRPATKPAPANDASEERLVEGDLRAIARQATASSHTVYEGLCAAGLAGPAVSLRAA